jgi:hypothetical protein
MQRIPMNPRTRRMMLILERREKPYGRVGERTE